MIKKKAIKKYNYIKNIAIIVACGDSLRFNSVYPKQYTELYGEILINHTIKNFLKNHEIGLVLLRLVEFIGEDELTDIGPETLYFMVSILNKLNLLLVVGDYFQIHNSYR